MRATNRKNNELREIKIETNVNMHAEGSCLISFGNTKVLCTASVEKKLPPFLRNQPVGWITGEYSMLPRATGQRNNRETRGQSGRTMEIQRLIGRSLRAIVDTSKFQGYTVTIDCDVIQADGGTRTTSITGAYVALSLAFNKMLEAGLIKENPITTQMAAISVGISQDEDVIVDLDYVEDSSAIADGNFVMTADGEIIEVQTTGEEKPIASEQFLEMFNSAKEAIKLIAEIQNKAL